MIVGLNKSTKCFLIDKSIFLQKKMCTTFGYLQWLALKTSLSTVTKRNSEDKTFYLNVTQPLQIAAVLVAQLLYKYTNENYLAACKAEKHIRKISSLTSSYQIVFRLKTSTEDLRKHWILTFYAKLPPTTMAAKVRRVSTLLYFLN
jgi:hypothetical protein